VKAWLVGRRELVDLFADRSYLFGFVALFLIPFALVTTIPGGGSSRSVVPLILILAIQSAMFPAFMSINAAATTFIQDKENQSLLPLLAAPIRDEQIVFGKAIAVFVPSIVASWIALSLYVVIASVRFGAPVVLEVLSPGMLLSLGMLAALLTVTIGSVGMIVASRVRSVRSAQQIAGMLIALVLVSFVATAQQLLRIADGWLIVLVPLAVLALDVVALEITRRLWGREEAIARI
jgi:ABC-type Na+ efflux pump permease subunit